MAVLVVDACVAIKWFVPEDEATTACELLSTDTKFHAPDVILIEVANALWKNARRGHIPAESATIAMERLPRFFAELVPFESLRRRTLELALALDHPVYDCAYLACALHYKQCLITADTKLAAKLAAAGYHDRVLLLSDWRP